MDPVKLEILGIEVPVEINIFSDDGFVDSIEEHKKVLLKRYGGNFLNYKKSDNPLLGAHYVREGGRYQGFINSHHIFYLDTGFNPLNVGVRGHEETHVLDYLGKIPLLADKILTKMGRKIDFEKIYDGEIRANIGGIYAVDSRGFSLNLIKKIFRKDNSFQEAMEIYKGERI